MKVSEITVNNLAEYCRVELEQLEEDEKDIENRNFEIFLKVAKEFVKNYTGLTEQEIDKHEDFSIVIFVLVSDMHDTRTFTIDKNNLNVVVDTILGFHDNNLL